MDLPQPDSPTSEKSRLDKYQKIHHLPHEQISLLLNIPPLAWNVFFIFFTDNNGLAHRLRAIPVFFEQMASAFSGTCFC